MNREIKENYLQVPFIIANMVKKYMDSLNIEYMKINEIEQPDFLPGIITFANKTYHCDEYITYLLDRDATDIRNILEKKTLDHTLYRFV